MTDFVRSRPDHDTVDELLQVAGDVADALPRTEHDVMGEIDGVTTELRHPGLERHPRPQTRLLEQHRQRPPHQRRPSMPSPRPELSLQRGRGPEHDPDFISREIGNAQQVTPTEGRSHRNLEALVMPRVALGRSGEGGSEHGRERTPGCVSVRAERPTHAWTFQGDAVD